MDSTPREALDNLKAAYAQMPAIQKSIGQGYILPLLALLDSMVNELEELKNGNP